LTYSGWLTHISGHPSAASRAQDSERTPAKDRCSTAGLRNQLSKEVLQTCWEQIGQDVIDHAMGQFRKRLSVVVATSGGHIEYRFDLCFWCYTYIIMLTYFVVEIQNLDDQSK